MPHGITTIITSKFPESISAKLFSLSSLTIHLQSNSSLNNYLNSSKGCLKALDSQMLIMRSSESTTSQTCTITLSKPSTCSNRLTGPICRKLLWPLPTYLKMCNWFSMILSPAPPNHNTSINWSKNWKIST